MNGIMNFITFKRGEDPVVSRFVRDHVPDPRRSSRGSMPRMRRSCSICSCTRGTGRPRCSATSRQDREFIRRSASSRTGGSAGSGKSRAFLDFASGYGRSTRFLIQELSPKRVWACDIYANAIAFQRRHLGVHGVVSVPDPADFPRGQKFDFIFASSFFSHMPESSFGSWFKTLRYLLTPPRDPRVQHARRLAAYPLDCIVPPEGMVFFPMSESRSLDANQYGSSYVNEEFVSRVVDGRPGANRGSIASRGAWSSTRTFMS